MPIYQQLYNLRQQQLPADQIGAALNKLGILVMTGLVDYQHARAGSQTHAIVKTRHLLMAADGTSIELCSTGEHQGEGSTEQLLTLAVQSAWNRLIALIASPLQHVSIAEALADYVHPQEPDDSAAEVRDVSSADDNTPEPSTATKNKTVVRDQNGAGVDFAKCLTVCKSVQRLNQLYGWLKTSAESDVQVWDEWMPDLHEKASQMGLSYVETGDKYVNPAAPEPKPAGEVPMLNGVPIDFERHIQKAGSIDKINAMLVEIRQYEAEGYDMQEWKKLLHNRATISLNLQYHSQQQIYIGERPTAAVQSASR